MPANENESAVDAPIEAPVKLAAVAVNNRHKLLRQSGVIKGQMGFPAHYGVVREDMPDGFVNQQLFPFCGITEPMDAA